MSDTSYPGAFMKEFLTIVELSEYLSVKRSTLYAHVESGELPHYRVGRLIRFKRGEVDHWIESRRHEIVDVDSKARTILKARNKGTLDVDKIIKKSIDAANGKDYTLPHGKPDQIEALRKEVKHGSL
jgi:excisionase family DNA binding protein